MAAGTKTVASPKRRSSTVRSSDWAARRSPSARPRRHLTPNASRSSARAAVAAKPARLRQTLDLSQQEGGLRLCLTALKENELISSFIHSGVASTTARYSDPIGARQWHPTQMYRDPSWPVRDKLAGCDRSTLFRGSRCRSYCANAAKRRSPTQGADPCRTTVARSCRSSPVCRTAPDSASDTTNWRMRYWPSSGTVPTTPRLCRSEGPTLHQRRFWLTKPARVPAGEPTIVGATALPKSGLRTGSQSAAYGAALREPPRPTSAAPPVARPCAPAMALPAAGVPAMTGLARAPTVGAPLDESRGPTAPWATRRWLALSFVWALQPMQPLAVRRRAAVRGPSP